MPAMAGKYKGHRFRSLLELSVLVQAEDDGYVLGTDILYETVRIPYGNDRTYIVDFHLVPENVLIEVKPSSRAATSTVKRKAAAGHAYAAANGLQYIILTELDMDRVLTFEDAKKLVGIEWGERAKRRIRRELRKKR